jgi:hypothetical protein
MRKINAITVRYGQKIQRTGSEPVRHFSEPGRDDDALTRGLGLGGSLKWFAEIEAFLRNSEPDAAAASPQAIENKAYFVRRSLGSLSSLFPNIRHPISARGGNE